MAKAAYFNLLTGCDVGDEDPTGSIRSNCPTPPGSNNCPMFCPNFHVDHDPMTWGQKYALRQCSAAGVSYMANDQFLRGIACSDAYLNRAGDYLAQYASDALGATRNSLFGFDLHDEVAALDPADQLHYQANVDLMHCIKQGIYRYKLITPDRPFLASFLPYYDVFPAQVTCNGASAQPNFSSRSVYEDYVRTYLTAGANEGTTDILAYDNYPFTAYGVRQTYFYNLSFMRSQAGDRPMWCHVLAQPHGIANLPGNPPPPQGGCYYTTFYPTPSEAQIRFMAFCPIAYGAKGLYYFTYEPVQDWCNASGLNVVDPATGHPKQFAQSSSDIVMKYWAGPAIVDDAGAKTSTYYAVQRVNRYVAYTLGPLVMSHPFVHAYHVTSQPTGEPVPSGELLSNSTVIASVAGTGSQGLLFGLFSDGSGGNYVTMVNKDWQNAASGIVLTVYGNRTLTVGPTSSDVDGGQSGIYSAVNGSYDPNLNVTTFNVSSVLSSLQAGGAVVMRIQDAQGSGGSGCNPPPCQIDDGGGDDKGSRPFGTLVVIPSPSHGITQFALAGTRDRLESVRVFDFSGRALAEMGSKGASNGFLTWDGRDRGGNAVRAGEYFYVARTSRGMLSGRFSIVR